VTTTLIRRTAPRRKRAYAPSGDVGKHLAEARSLQLRIQELTALYDAERAWLLTHMQQQGLQSVELGAIRCVLKERSRWSYSPETERDMQALQVTQKWEQSHGIAQNTPTHYTAITEAQS
jgi:hypothetical protein